MANNAPSDSHPIFSLSDSEPESLQGKVVLIGYHAVHGETIRVYTSLEFSAWVDVAREAVVAFAVDQASKVLPSVLWVRPTAEVRVGSVQGTEAQYLKGSIS